MKQTSIFPQLAGTWLEHGARFFYTSAGGWGAAFEVTPIELETKYAGDFQSLWERQTQYIRRLKPGIRVRSISRRRIENDIGPHIRQDAIRELGFLDTRLFLFFEKDELPYQVLWRDIKTLGLSEISDLISEKEKKQLIEDIDIASIRDLGLDPAPLAEDVLTSFFGDSRFEEFSDKSGIEFRGGLRGVTRLYKLGTSAIEADYLTIKRSSQFFDSDLVVQFRKISRQSSQLKLQLQKKRSESAVGLNAAENAQAAERDYADAVNRGETHCEMEWFFVLSRASEERLRSDSIELVSAYSSLGTVMVETVGAQSSFEASLPGSPMHVTFPVKDHQVPFMWPIYKIGSSKREHPKLEPHLLPLHRRDHSLLFFDIYDKKHVNRNVMILGPTGSGKSSLVCQLIYCMAQNPNYKITMMEVGSSFRKLFGVLGGKYYDLEVGKPAGINPFKLVLGKKWGDNAEAQSKEAQILTEYLSALILENGEEKISKEMRAAVSHCLLEYLEQSTENLTIDGLLDLSKERFPRAKILSQWRKDQIYGSFFLPKEVKGNPRLNCFNYKSVGDAADPDLAQGGVATLMAHFQLDSLGKKEGERPFLFIDECKFFFPLASSIFAYLVTNIRKFGGGVGLMSQSYTDFQLEGAGGEAVDKIFENCFSHFLFSQSGLSREFLKRHHLRSPEDGGEDDLQKIGSLVFEPGKRHEVLLSREGLGAQVLCLHQSAEEFIRTNTEAKFTESIEKLMAEIPELSYEAAIYALGFQRRAQAFNQVRAI